MVAGAVAAIYPFYLAGMWYVLGRPDRARLIHTAVIRQQIPVFITVTLGALSLVALGLWMRHRHGRSLLFQHLTANYFGVSLVWVGYLTGTLNFAAGIVLMGSVITGYIVLDRRVILLAMFNAFVLLLSFNIASAFGKLPYAPAFVSPGDASTRLFWLWAAFYLAVPHILIYLMATTLMLAQWRRRESGVLRLGVTDMLTGLHNRRYMLDMLRQEARNAHRHSRPLVVALLDLDHFKTINDCHGHLTGDRVLVGVASELRALLKGRAEPGRFGGEEFLLVLPDLTEEQARDCLEQCRRAIQALDIRDDEGKAVPVTASIGVAGHSGQASMSPEALIKAADDALYRAKKDGRNRLHWEAADTVANQSVEAAPVRQGQEVESPGRGGAQATRAWLRSRITGGLRLNETAMMAVFVGLISMLYMLYLGWGLYVRTRPDQDKLINASAGDVVLPLIAAVIALGVLLAVIGFLKGWRGAESRWVRIAGNQYISLSLLFFGYLVGLMSMPTGVVLLGSPLVGMLFFPADLVLGGFGLALVGLIVLSWLGMLGTIPYAPLVPADKLHLRVDDPFWMFSYYFFMLPVMVFIVGILDRVLGLWRQRGVHIRSLSITDPLTRVNNRRHIMAFLESAFAQACNDGSPLSVVLLDLDHFKSINDERGHPVGDRVLVSAAGVLAEQLREEDAVGRYGGEEFLLVLPGTDEQGALALAERCRERLGQWRVTDDAGEEFLFTGSFGVAGLRPPDSDVNTLLKRADEALYRAKDNGRNRVVYQ